MVKLFSSIMFTKLLIISAAIALISGSPLSFRSQLPAGNVIAPFLDEVDGLEYRLPNNTIPLRYDVNLKTDIHNGSPDFTGEVVITFKQLDATQTITIHYRQLIIVNIDLISDLGTNLETNVPSTKKEDVEFLIIQPTVVLAAQQTYKLRITYTGQLRDDNMGFYRSSYKDQSGVTHWLATTQFESTDARHAFPCYDEPQIRTPFSISLTYDSSYSAISNMPSVIDVGIPGSNYMTTTFQDTPDVQTYLIAFVVSDFKSLDDNDLILPQRVFAKPQSIASGEAVLALDAGKKILDMFIEHLKVSYDLPKMDQIAVPDFDAGAMENWGLVTYREEYLLYNPDIATTRQRENILTIISHEFAHQWFGDHVAPKWWSYIWLNEGFATLYENYLVSLVYPDERFMDTFNVDVVQTVLETDANPNIRAMTYYVESPERIGNLFDRVAYDKSGSVLRMMQVALGVDTWTKGLGYYLTDQTFKAATSADLYAGLQKAVTEDILTNAPNVATIMSTWETQSGYPLIHVTRSNSELTITQNRFFYTEQTSENVWWVPINYVVGSTPDFSNTNPDLWMEGQKSVTIQKTAAPRQWNDDDWMVLNVQQSGYYRVNYDDNLWNLLIQQLNSESDGYDKIHLLNRAQLVDDSLNLARAGKLEYDVPFGIMEYLSKETDYIPWAAANRGMTLLNRWLSGSSGYKNYQAFVRKIAEPLFNKLGVNVVANEHKLDRYARNIAINLVCQAGLETCLTQTAEKLQEFISKDVAIAPDLTSAIYCNGLRQADAETFSFLQNKMFNSEDQAERTLIIAALGCSQDSTLLTSFLNLALVPGSALRLQEKFRVFNAPLNNGEVGLQVLIDFIRDNSEGINEIEANQVKNMLSNIASRISSQALYEAYNSLLTKLQTDGLITAENVASYQASASVNIEWQAKNLGKIEEYFRNDDTTTIDYSTSESSGTTSAGETTEQVTDTSVDTGSTIAETTTLGAGSVVVSTIVLLFSVAAKFAL